MRTMSADYLNKLFGLEGQTAGVIGGAGVLGGALCRGLTQAGAKIVVGPIDISALRHERSVRKGHRMLDHLRTEAYPVYRNPRYTTDGPDPHHSE